MHNRNPERRFISKDLSSYDGMKLEEYAFCQLENYHAAKCILSVDGISADAGLTLYYSNEAPLARKMIESSSKTIVVADSTKIGKGVFARITDASKTDILVTNPSENKKELLALQKLGVKIYTTGI